MLCCCSGSVSCSILHLGLRTNEKTFNYPTAELEATLIPHPGLELLPWWSWAALGPEVDFGCLSLGASALCSFWWCLRANLAEPERFDLQRLSCSIPGQTPSVVWPCRVWQHGDPAGSCCCLCVSRKAGLRVGADIPLCSQFPTEQLGLLPIVSHSRAGSL